MKLLATTILVLLCTLLCSAQTDQTITFDALPAKTLGDTPFTISATASSALPVTFSSTNTEVAIISGNTVTITGIGITMIKASQSGNGGFNPAPGVSQMLTIKNVTQTPAEQGQLWGISAGAGSEKVGVLFKTNGDGTGYVTVKEFEVDGSGCFPGLNAKLVQVNGKFYGLTPKGGQKNAGVLFEFDPANGNYSRKIDIASIDGRIPVGKLVELNGKLYGATSNGGGFQDRGVIFEFDPVSATITKKLDIPAGVGSMPAGGMSLSATGKLYGMTRYGSINSSAYGGVYEYDPLTNTMTGRANGMDNADGYLPTSLTLAANGKFYGITSLGGSAAQTGVLFEFDPATNTYTKKYTFVAGAGAGTVGQWPTGELTAASNGKLYGMTSTGGANNRGVVFRYDPGATTVDIELSFLSDNGSPWGSLTEGEDGMLYGMDGGDGVVNNPGAIFRFDPDVHVYELRYSFNQQRGSNPQGAVTIVNGKLYGLTSRGGAGNAGVLFEFNIASGVYTKKYEFLYAPEGARPSGAPVQASNGKLYGTTSEGGAENSGILYEYDIVAETFTKRADFARLTSGATPLGKLTLGVNGKLYGMTSLGGSINNGTLFEFDPTTNTLQKKLDFASAATGYSPTGSLVVSGDGKLWGMAPRGGNANSYGLIFEYNPENNQLTGKYDFDGIHGSSPYGTLLPLNGKFYGITATNGLIASGVIFEFNPLGGIYTVKGELSSTLGQTSYGSVTAAGNKLYAITSSGGASDGSIVELNLDNGALVKKIDLTHTNGGRSKGDLLLAANGKLYGMGFLNVNSAQAALFEFDPSTGVHTIKKEFPGAYDAANGELYSSVMQIQKAIRKDQTLTFSPIPDKKMGDPSFVLTASATSALPIQFLSSSDKVTISGNNQAILAKPGSVTITAVQPGDADYHAAQVQHTFCVIPAKPTITMSGENTEELVLTSDNAAGNQWYLNDEPIVGATSQSFSPVEAGIYKVKISIDGCTGEMSDGLPLIVTGLPEIQKPNIAIFPNPAENKLFVKLPSGEENKIMIMHSDGTSSMEYTASGPVLEINVRDYTPGIYLLRISNKKGSATQKFIKR
jgi:uncharacterized repeat protein (TIGR03803 family)